MWQRFSRPIQFTPLGQPTVLVVDLWDKEEP
jgi:hypothetical protein